MFTFETGSGFWNPLVWIIIFVVAFLIGYILRSFGKRTYKEGTEQTKSFLSGNEEYDKEHMQIKSSNLYWGFTESFSWLYSILKKLHTGNASDYIVWFVVVLGLFLLAGVML